MIFFQVSSSGFGLFSFYLEPQYTKTTVYKNDTMCYKNCTDSTDITIDRNYSILYTATEADRIHVEFSQYD